LCVSELIEHGTIDRESVCKLFVQRAIQMCVEMKDQDRRLVCQLFARLHSENLVSDKNYSQGLDSVLQVEEDIELDTPRALEYIGQIIALLISSGALSITNLQSLISKTAKSAKLAAFVFANLNESKDETTLVELFRQANFKFASDQQTTFKQLLQAQGLQILADK